MQNEKPQEKRAAQLTAMYVSSEAMIEKWGADLERFQGMIDNGEHMSHENMRRYQFLKAFLVVSMDRRAA
jgi:hypothetical protein